MNIIKGPFLLLLIFLCYRCTDHHKHVQVPSGFQSFNLEEVKLLPGSFKNAQQLDMQYMLELDPDRLLAPYLMEAGLSPGKESYANWENTGLDGHIGGHYLTALSQMWAATGDKRLEERLDHMLKELQRCQNAIGTGYLGGTPGGTTMWKDIAQGKIVSDNFALNGKWVPLYNIHKLFAGLRDAYMIAEKPLAKEILINLTDFIEKISIGLTDKQIQTMLVSEHGGLNEVFADVYAITGEKKYLALAKKFSHRMILDPLVKHQDSLTGLHANTQIPKVVGFQRIAEVGGGQKFETAARFFWETVVNNRTVVIGGNSVQEHFNPIDNYSDMVTNIAGPETCNTYNMLKLSRHLFETDGSVKYLDYYERALYNHILSSQHPVHGGFVYYTPMRPRHYRVYSQPTQCMWCCVGSGMENHGKYGELIYSHRDKDLYINLFISSRLNWSKTGLLLSQQTNFPDEASTQIIIEEVGNSNPDIYIRYPGWMEPGQLKIRINEHQVEVNEQPGSFVYVKLNRAWKKGDKIDVSLPMPFSTETLPGDSSYLAFLHGPIVLAAKIGTADLDNLIGDSVQWEGYRARGKIYPLDSAPMLLSNKPDLDEYFKAVPGNPQTFIAPGLFNSTKYNDLKLIPFYKLHDARYMIYWKIKPPE